MAELAEVLDGVGNLLSAVLWPALLLFIFLSYREEIREQLKKDVAIKAFGVEAEFVEREISRLRLDVAPLEEATYTHDTATIGGGEAQDLEQEASKDWADRDVVLDAMENPPAAIDSLASDIRTAVFRLALATSVDTYRVGVPHPQFRTTVGRLCEAGVIDSDLERGLYTFLDLSNAVTDKHTVSREAYGELLEAGVVLYETIQALLMASEVEAEPRAQR